MDPIIIQSLIALGFGSVFGLGLALTTEEAVLHIFIATMAAFCAFFFGLTAGLLMVSFVGLIEIGVIINYRKKYLSIPVKTT